MSQVTNYTVDNAAGNVVRADINTILEAVRTNNSGGSDPSNPIKFMLYGKSSDDTLRIYDGSNFRVIGDVGEDNLGLIAKTGGTMTGALLADDAAGASAPALSFDGDADTGIFRKGANTIGLATAGTERAFVDSGGLTIQARGDIRLADSDSSNYVALQAAATVGSSITFTLPSADGSDGQMLKTNGSGTLSFTTVQGVPSGAVFCLAVSNVPADYLECNGQSVSRTTYAALFAVIGTTYGGSGSNFNVPDLRGEFVRGWDNGRGADSGRSIATSQGDQNEAHTHGDGSLSGSTNNPGNHRHNYTDDDHQGNASSLSSWGVSRSSSMGGGGSTGGDTQYGWITSAAGSHTHTVTISGSTASSGGESRPRNIAMMYIIKT